MFKRIFSLLLVVVMMFSFSSCRLQYLENLKNKILVNSPYPEEMKGKLQSVNLGNEYGNDLVYKENTYINLASLFIVTDDLNNKKNVEGDIFLSWDSNVFGDFLVYYAETEENPLFIYETCSGDIFIREDYDYKSDTFVLEGTDLSIVFSECLTETYTCSDLMGASHSNELTFVSKTNSRLKLLLKVFEQDGKWYAGGRSNDVFLYASDNLINLLNQENIAIYES